MRQEKRRRRWPWVVLLILALAALAYGFWTKYQAEQNPPILDTDGSGISHVDDDLHIEPPPAVENFTCRVNGFVDPAGAPLTEEHTILMGEFMDAWYLPLAQFDEPEMDALFTKSEDAASHEAALRSLILIRQAALADLRMESVDYTLTVTDVEEEDGFLRVEADETTTMRFAATPETDSVLYDMPHIFIFDDRGESMTLYHHEADDNPYFSFTYEEGSTVDAEMERMLRAIERRQLLRGEKSYIALPCDHPYDRDAALAYLYEYCDERNPLWYAYDEVGGNCMNFGSQVLLAGGIPMDERGDNEWYWRSTGKLDLSWINVGNFYDYARKNSGYGLVADTEAGYYTGEVGDVLIVGYNGDHRHTTIISDIVYDDSGEVVDYLLSCNTTNYRDFPAGAYYYTFHRLIKIFGWNEG